jgi:hypothetical protein
VALLLVYGVLQTMLNIITHYKSTTKKQPHCSQKTGLLMTEFLLTLYSLTYMSSFTVELKFHILHGLSCMLKINARLIIIHCMLFNVSV